MDCRTVSPQRCLRFVGVSTFITREAVSMTLYMYIQKLCSFQNFVTEVTGVSTGAPCFMEVVLVDPQSAFSSKLFVALVTTQD